jgi:hypothetical protein
VWKPKETTTVKVEVKREEKPNKEMEKTPRKPSEKREKSRTAQQSNPPAEKKSEPVIHIKKVEAALSKPKVVQQQVEAPKIQPVINHQVPLQNLPQMPTVPLNFFNSLTPEQQQQMYQHMLWQ